MRRRLAIVGSLLILSGAGIFWAAFSRLLWRLGLEWDVPFLLEQLDVILITGLWAAAVGLCCFCALLFTTFTNPQVRARLSGLPIGVALAILLLTAYLTVLITAITGVFCVRKLEGPGGAHCTVVARASLSPDAKLWLGPVVADADLPDFRVDTEVWGPYVFQPSKTPGRYLLVGDRQEAGALIDLSIPSMIGFDELPDLETLRAEFGPDVVLARGGD